MKYPFQDQLIVSWDDLRKFVGAVVEHEAHTTEEKNAARKRVWSRIAEGKKKGELSSSLSGIDPCIFFTWAVKQKKWQQLLEVEGLPYNSLHTSSVVCSNLARSGSMRILVETREDSVAVLQKMYETAENARLAMSIEIRMLRLRLDECESELYELHKKVKEFSEQMSASGKKGGRGNTK